MRLGLIFKDKKNILKALRHLRLCLKLTEDNDLSEKVRNYIKDVEGADYRVSTPDREISPSVQEVPDVKSAEPVLKSDIAFYEDKLKDNPDDFTIYNKLAALYYEEKDIAQAKAMYRKSLDIKPSFAETYLNIALIYKEENDVLRAMRNLRLCIKASEDKELIKKAKFYIDEIEGSKEDDAVSAEAVTTLQESDSKKYEDKRIFDEASSYNKEGQICYENGDLDGARIYYRKALEADPDFAEAHLNLGILYREQQNVLKALRHLKLCIRASVDEIMKETAQNYIDDIEKGGKEKKEPEEENDFETKEIVLEKIEEKVRHMPSEITDEDYSRQRRRLDHLKEELTGNPQNLDLNKKVAQVYRQMRDYDSAIECYRKVLELEPSNAANYLDMALVCKDYRKFSDSLKYLKICARKAATSELLSEVKDYMAEVERLASEVKPVKEDIVRRPEKAELDSVKEEIKNYEEMLEESPGDKDLFIKLARAYSLLKDSKKSLQYYKEYLDVNNEDARVHLEIALIYKDMGKLFNAIKHLRLCINFAYDEELKITAGNYISEIE